MPKECPFRDKPVVKYLGKWPVAITSCPTCGRNENKDFPEKVRLIEEALTRACRADLKVAVMNCRVNGLGECGDADIGVLFGKGRAAIYRKGKHISTVKSEEVVGKFMEIVRYIW